MYETRFAHYLFIFLPYLFSCSDEQIDIEDDKIDKEQIDDDDDDDNDDDDNNCGDDLFEEVADELQAIQSAAINLANDPSAENCTILKKAYLIYIEALEDLLNCATLLGFEKTWQDTIDEMKSLVSEVC